MSRRLFLGLVAVVCLSVPLASPAVAAPANDNLADAVAITGLPFAHSVNTADATTEANERHSNCAFEAGHGVWYRYTPGATVTARIDTVGSDYDTVLSVWTGAGTYPMRELACSDDAADLTSAVEMNLRAGTPYYFKVEGLGDDSGFATLNVTARPAIPTPANDDWANALAIGALPYTYSMTSTGGTDEPGERSASCIGTYALGAGVWFRYAATADGYLRVDTIGSDYDTILSAWTGTGVQSLTEVACNDDTDVDAGVYVSSTGFQLVAGQTYYVRVEALGYVAGDLTLNAALVTRPPNDDLAGAQTVDALPYSHTVDTDFATTEASERTPSCVTTAGHGVWYRYTSTGAGNVRITTSGSNFDTVLSVWTGTGHPLGEVACNDDYDDLTSRIDLPAVAPGTTYYIKAEGLDADFGRLSLHVAVITVAANDNLAAARTVTALPFSETVNTEAATSEPGERGPSCVGAAGHGVWYRYTAPDASPVRVSTAGSSYDTVLSVWTCAGHPLTEVACNDDFSDLSSRVELTGVVAGTTYYIKAEGLGTDAGDLTLNVYSPQAPANDDLSAAVAIGALPFSHAANTEAATTESGERTPSCVFATDHGVWYRYTATGTAPVRIDTAGSNYDTVLSVWTGAGHPLTEVACNDDAGDLTSRIDLAGAVAGTTYYIKAEGLEDDSGDLVLHVTALQPPANDNLAGAIRVEAVPFTHSTDTGDATTELGELPSACSSGGGHGVWYRYTPAATVTTRIDTTGSDYDTVLSVWAGSAHPLRELTCNDDADGLTSAVEMNLHGGNAYYIKVEGLAGDSGRATLHVRTLTAVPTPANDDWANALAIGALPYTHTMNAVGGTDEAGEPGASCCPYPHGGGVWYRFTAPSDGYLHVDTIGSDYDTVLSIWTGSSVQALTELGCNDDIDYDSGVYTSSTGTPVTAGRTYYVRADALGSVAGQLTLNASWLIRPANDDLAAAMVIGSLPFTHNVSTVDATDEPRELGSACAQMTGHGVWYRFSPASTATARVDTVGSDYDTVLSVWMGTAHPLRELTCNDDIDYEAGNLASQVEMTFRGGSTYYIKAEGIGATAAGNLTLHVTALPAVQRPANDDLAGALTVGALPFTHNTSTVGATVEDGETLGSCVEDMVVGGSVWYRFTATTPGQLRVDTVGSDYDTVLTAWTGAGYPLTEVACNDDIDFSGGIYASAVTLPVTPGQTYYFRVDSFLGVGGDLTLHVGWIAPPENDDLADALPVGAGGLTHTVFTELATTEPNERMPGCVPSTGHGVWYRYTATSAARLRVTTVGSTFDTVLSAWTGTRHPLTEVACNDDFDGLTSRIDLTGMVPGQTYYIKAEGLSSEFGILTLSASVLQRPANDDRANALHIDGLPFTHRVNTEEATMEANELGSSCAPMVDNSVWYRFEAEGPFSARLHTEGSDYDTVLSVWTESGPLTEVACNDDESSGTLTSAVELPNVPAGTYWIKVEGLDSSGDMVLHMDWIGTPPAWGVRSRNIYLPFSTRGAAD